MARDRLAAMRAQQGGQGAYGDQSYPQQQQSYPQQQTEYAPPTARYGEGGQGYAGNQPSYPPTSNYNSASDSMPAFYEEISAIQDETRAMNDNVAQISELHSRSLNNTDEMATKRIEGQLESLIEDTRAMMGNLKTRIQNLERKPGQGRDGQIRQQQTGLVKSKFKEAIQNYQDAEKQFRQKYKARMERQFRIVKPDATPEEIKAAVNDEQGGQVFAQALMNSNRYGESKAAYQEVQERHRDIQKIERTITELAQLFNDMSMMVEQQDESLNVIQANAEKVNVDTEAGLQHTEKAVVSARAARKKRWICFGIIVVILIIVAIVVAIEVEHNKN
ncbi:Plasma membrane t-SNARE, secretory vesicle fusion [Tulasnella sp. 330]|nr:Plasma membrane t-SNARE, secretory vesicle fusion [Tulasnella sp. 330]KAG8869694.1 Plasma membrane t-SNARE, secretory vesicle fusion [Tulasnella sp. 331]KAG8871567.1 Plasma membrane t-SNARE, secretory vesicle fusion [Tulasnella sp. 332]